MATDYFVSAVYGVLLGPEDLGAFLETMAYAKDEVAECDEDDELCEEEVVDRALAEVLAKCYPDLLAGLRAKFGAPDDAELFWTGPEDDRPGRCDCEPDRWVLGYGLFDPGLNLAGLPEKFKAGAKWHTWVTCG